LLDSVPDLPAGLTNRWTAPSTGSDGDLIATLTDSIAGNNGTAAGSARPTLKTGANGLNGRNVLRFDGVANSFSISSISGAGPWTIAAVVKTTAMPIIGSNTQFFAGIYRGGANKIEIGVTSGNYQYAPTAAAPADAWEIVILSHSGSASGASGSINATDIVFGANDNAGPGGNFTRIGQFNYVLASGGKLADLLIWPTVLGASDRAAARANLQNYWGGVY
jgi:hypothetical protein